MELAKARGPAVQKAKLWQWVFVAKSEFMSGLQARESETSILPGFLKGEEQRSWG